MKIFLVTRISGNKSFFLFFFVQLKLTTTLPKYQFSNNVRMMLTFLLIEYSRCAANPLSTKKGASKDFFHECDQIHKKL